MSFYTAVPTPQVVPIRRNRSQHFDFILGAGCLAGHLLPLRSQHLDGLGVLLGHIRSHVCGGGAHFSQTAGSSDSPLCLKHSLLGSLDQLDFPHHHRQEYDDLSLRVTKAGISQFPHSPGNIYVSPRHTSGLSLLAAWCLVGSLLYCAYTFSPPAGLTLPVLE